MSENHICVNLWLHHVKFHCNLCETHLLCKHVYWLKGTDFNS